jgi:hypothetical protein
VIAAVRARTCRFRIVIRMEGTNVEKASAAARERTEFATADRWARRPTRSSALARRMQQRSDSSRLHHVRGGLFDRHSGRRITRASLDKTRASCPGTHRSRGTFHAKAGAATARRRRRRDAGKAGRTHEAGRLQYRARCGAGDARECHVIFVPPAFAADAIMERPTRASAGRLHHGRHPDIDMLQALTS